MKHHADLPDGAMATCVFEVVGYMDDRGEMLYAIRMDGDVPMSTTLGLVYMAAHDVIAERDEDD